MFRLLYNSFVLSISVLLLLNQPVWAQSSNLEDFVAYEKQSNFIKEFEVPFDELGIRGVATDSGGNVWFYHSTNMTSTLVLFDPDRNEFTKFPVEGKTDADNAIINLASAQLTFDDRRNAVWFTDARINSIGMLDIPSGKIGLWQVPTKMAGPMGIALSPDGRDVWFTEITGDKIARFDIESGEITEYSTGEGSGPALLTFDDKGQLWVTLSFSNSILLAQPWAIVPGSSLGMTNFSLPEPDRFSPFGIAVTGGKIFLSDHGSSRVLAADENSGLQNYDEYWTSLSLAYPTTLPSQIVADSQGNIYFVQHGGNRISEINPEGIMTEYDVPTGPLSTVVFLSASQDGKVWFAEWASNKIAYLDTAMQLPFTLNIEKTGVTLDRTGPGSIKVSLNSLDAASPASLSEVEVGLTGMTDSGLAGVTYEAQPPRVNLQDERSAESEIVIRAQENARPGNYVAMVKAVAPDNDGLLVSRLYPFELVLDVPEPSPSQGSNVFQSQQEPDTTARDALRIGAPLGVAGVIAFAIYRWKKARTARRIS